MPELPEVETIVGHLRPKIRGKRIWGVEVKGRRVLRYHQNPKEFIDTVVGRKIKNIVRLGKNIIFELSGGACFAVHLMMTGRLLLSPPKAAPHDRLVLRLSGGQRLVFNDMRQFGWCRLVRSPHAPTGPDAVAAGFKEFKKALSGRRGAIKNVLLNQKIIAGIGNIYSDEILWYAGIGPMRKANFLKEREVRKLYDATQKVLGLAIKKEGSSARDYRKPDGSRGGYYEIRKVYRRSGEQCLRDGAIIQRIKIGQRSAHFCPKHQK